MSQEKQAVADKAADTVAQEVEKNTDTATQEAEKVPRTWRQRLLSWSWQLALVVLIYLGVTTWMTRSLLASGQPAPAFVLKDLQGKVHSLQQYHGKQVILHFWATWCGVCKTNIPVLRWMSTSYRENPVLLSVVQDAYQRKAILEIQRTKGIKYPILMANNKILKDYRVSQFPTTYFIDSRGRVFSKDVGFISPFGFWWRSWVSGIKTWFGF